MNATSRRLSAGTATITLLLAGLLGPSALVMSSAASTRGHHGHHANARPARAKGHGARPVEGSLSYELTPASSSLLLAGPTACGHESMAVSWLVVALVELSTAMRPSK